VRFTGISLMAIGMRANRVSQYWHWCYSLLCGATRVSLTTHAIEVGDRGEERGARETRNVTSVLAFTRSLQTSTRCCWRSGGDMSKPSSQVSRPWSIGVVGCYKGGARVLHGCDKGVTWVLQKCHKGVT
jgi:hypothetical protein